MKPTSFGEHETRRIGAPEGWDPDKDGECGTLSVHDFVTEHDRPAMLSRWELEPGDLEKLQQGAPIHLSVLGQVHPVVSVFVGDVPPPATAQPQQEPAHG